MHQNKNGSPMPTIPGATSLEARFRKAVEPTHDAVSKNYIPDRVVQMLARGPHAARHMIYYGPHHKKKVAKFPFVCVLEEIIARPFPIGLKAA